MEVLMKAPGTASAPLVAWLVREFEPHAAFGGWEFRMRRGSGTPRLYQAQSLDDGRIVVDVPQLGNEPIARVAVVDVNAGRTLADSADTSGLVVSEEAGAGTRVDDLAVDVSRRRRFLLSGVAPSASSRDRSVVLRLWGNSGRLLAIVPVVTVPQPRAIVRD
jgi:hypothetical protein